MTDLGKIVPTEAGEWDSSVSYERLTFVKHNGATYLSIADSQGQEPSKDSDYWMFLVEEVPVDEELSAISEHPVQNKVVNEAITALGAAVIISDTAPSRTENVLWVKPGGDT